MKELDDKIQVEEKLNKINSIEKELLRKEEVFKLCPAIIEVIKKFDGKQSNKRLDTALKNIDKNLRFKTQYNSWIIEHVSYDINIVHASISSSYGDGVEQNGVIIADVAIADLNKNMNYRKEQAIKTREQNKIDIIDGLIEESEELKKKIKEFNEKINYAINDKFDIRIDLR